MEMGSFNSPVFGTNGGMWKECKLCLSNLADKLSRKSGESYASAISWLRTRISFEILDQSIHLYQRPEPLFTRTHADFFNVFVVLVF